MKKVKWNHVWGIFVQSCFIKNFQMNYDAWVGALLCWIFQIPNMLYRILKATENIQVTFHEEHRCDELILYHSCVKNKFDPGGQRKLHDFHTFFDHGGYGVFHRDDSLCFKVIIIDPGPISSCDIFHKFRASVTTEHSSMSHATCKWFTLYYTRLSCDS